jgi:hypothetical protein
VTEYELFDDPPPSNGARASSWRNDFVAFLKAHPGKWAEAPRTYDVHTSAASTAATWLKKDGCEAVTRTIDNRRLVYARWPDD